MASQVRPATLPARLPPALVAAAAAAGCALVAVVDPNEPGRYPTCPFLLATGRWCPGCGTLRGIRALLQGDLTRAADLNLLLVLALPVALSAWLLWALTAWGLRAPGPCDCRSRPSGHCWRRCWRSGCCATCRASRGWRRSGPR